MGLSAIKSGMAAVKNYISAITGQKSAIHASNVEGDIEMTTLGARNGVLNAEIGTQVNL